MRQTCIPVKRASEEKDAVIRKEKGEYCVHSEGNSDWSGGCYPSKGEAEKRLKQVEYFKHKGAYVKDSKVAMVEAAVEFQDAILADKIASKSVVSSEYKTLLDAKVEWAEGVADAMAKRFESYGGWRDYKISAKVNKAPGSVSLSGESKTYGFSIWVEFKLQGEVVLSATFDKHAVHGQDVDLLEMMQQVEDQTNSIKVSDHDPVEKLVMDVSLWFSKFVNKIPRQ